MNIYILDGSTNSGHILRHEHLGTRDLQDTVDVAKDLRSPAPGVVFDCFITYIYLGDWRYRFFKHNESITIQKLTELDDQSEEIKP